MKLLSWARNDFHFWRSILIALVLVVLPFVSYSNVAAAQPPWQPFTPGGAGWEVLDLGSATYYRFNGAQRLSYDPGSGQWSQKGQLDGETWSNLGNAGQSATFIGDGTSHSIGSGWSYMYNGSNARNQDSAWFSLNGTYRLAYNYTEGQWWQKGTDWSKVGNAGLSAAFIGDGTDRSIGSGWTYMYNGSNARNQDSAWFSINGTYRLAYNYTEGQWWQKGTDWSKVGSAGLSTAFIGDGTDRSIGSGWTYMYNGSNAKKQDSAWFSINGTYRLAYNYTEGQWWQKGIDWSKLGSAGLSTAFIADGTDRDLKNGWSYSYVASSDEAQWKDGAAARLAYNYKTSQWSDFDGNSWNYIGTSGVSSKFIGDGQSYALGLHHDYQYRYQSGQAHYARYYDEELWDWFHYDYSIGQWQYNSPTNGLQRYNLGAGGSLSDFSRVGMGDVGLRWSFADGVDTDTFGFNPANTINSYIQYNSIGRMWFYDDRGHKVAEGVLQPGSMGVRIAVDRSYVGKSLDWSSYWNWWGNYSAENGDAAWQQNYSPLVLVLDANRNTLFKQTLPQHILGIGQQPLWPRNGEAWIWEDTNGNDSYDSNATLDGDRILHWRQGGKGNTCWLFAPMNVTESVKGNGPNQLSFGATYADDTLYWASTQGNLWPVGHPNRDTNPLYDPSTMDFYTDSTLANYGQAPGIMDISRSYINNQGFLNGAAVFGGQWTGLVDTVESGKLAVVWIDNSQIMAGFYPAYDEYGHPSDADHDNYLDAAYVTTGSGLQFGMHMIWLRGFQRDPVTNEITHAIVEDSGNVCGAVGRIPIEHLQRAYSNAVTAGLGYGTFDAPNGFTWSTAGVDTWKFNPAIYSASW